MVLCGAGLRSILRLAVIHLWFKSVLKSLSIEAVITKGSFPLECFALYDSGEGRVDIERLSMAPSSGSDVNSRGVKRNSTWGAGLEAV